MLTESNQVDTPLDMPAAARRGETKSDGSRIIELMRRDQLTAFMEVHSGLSARIADLAGFEAIWASGLAISSLMGLRDSNEASWSQVLTIVEWIVDASPRPLLVDGDSGHGNFNNARRFASKLAKIGAAGVCFEDKLFPKTNSFVGERQELAGIDEFSGRIAASKDACSGYDFAVVARTEALVSGRSMNEALDRAHAYCEAGADAILIHSKRATGDEVIEFSEKWNRRSPLIVVPTTYPNVDLDVLNRAGVTGVIWANHSIRASARAMEDVCADIRRSGSPDSNSPRLVSVQDLFSLLDYHELDAAERNYLPDVEA